MIGLNVENGGVISYGDGRRRFESVADFANQTAFAEITKVHTMASALLRRRRGPRTSFDGLLCRSAALKTLLTSSTKTNFISLRIVSLTSSRSRLLSEGRMTVWIFARRAARTF